MSTGSSSDGSLHRSVEVSSVAAVPLLLAAGIVVGCFEGLLDGDLQGLLAHAQGAVLSGIPALGVGIVVAGVSALSRRQRWAARAFEWRRRVTSRDPQVDREPVVRWQALVLTLVLTLSVWMLLSRIAFGVLLELQEEELAVVLAVGLSIAGVVGGSIASSFIAPLLVRPLLRLDRRWPLPLPPWPWLRYAVFIALPGAVGLLALARRLADLVGDPMRWLAIPLVLVVAGLVLHGWRALRPLSLGRRTAAGVALVLVWLALVLLIGRNPARGVGERNSSPTTALGAALARRSMPPRAASAELARSVTSSAATTSASAPPASSGAFLTPPEARGKHYNIVWVIVDALRADKIGATHAGQPITPELDQFARESVVFSRAYSQGAATSYSIPSMLTGKNVDAISWHWAHDRPQILDSELTIAERLHAHGYETQLVCSQFIKGSLTSVLQGYDQTLLAAGAAKKRRWWATRTSPLATARALSSIAELAPGARAERPFFLTVYYGEPHSPYVNHPDLGRRFPTTAEGRYDSDVAFMDQHLGQLLAQLRVRTRLYADTIVIVTADHGEAFGEHDSQRHGRTCHTEAVHVPLMIRIPGVKPANVGTPVALVDLVPTLIELVGAARDGGELSGQSLLIPLLAPERVDPERPILNTAAHQRSDKEPYLMRAVRQGRYALFRNQNAGTFALFDTDADPGEARDLSADPAQAERIRRMQERLDVSLTGNVGQPPPPKP